jgi:hypothetical protein
MECPLWTASFRFSAEQGRSQSAPGRAYQCGTCRLRFSFFANDFDLRSRAVPLPFGWRRLARARHEPPRPSRPLRDVRLDLVSDDETQSKGL